MSVEKPQDDKRRPWRRIALIGGGVLLAGYAAAVAWSAGGVPVGTSVAGVDIGGQSVDEATMTLNTELEITAAEAIEITALDASSEILPAKVGLALDAQATAEQAAGPVWNPVRLAQHLMGGVEVPPVVTYNDEKLAKAVNKFAAGADALPTQPRIEMSMTPTVVAGKNGEGVDREASEQLIVDSYLFTSGAIALPVITLEPSVSDDEADSVRADFAAPAVAAPVLVTTTGAEDTLEPEVIAEALSFSPEEGTLQPELNLEKVRAALPDLEAVERPGRDATFDVSSGSPVVVPSRPGRGITDESLSTSILAVLPEGPDRVAEVEVTDTQPQLTTRQAKALNIDDQLSSFTQAFPYAEYRRVNVGQAAEYMNGTILLPGETYSMNDTIKERTEANGYTSGTFIGAGGRFEEGLGGGVSIATTATWTAAFFAGLEAVEVNPHSLYISRYQAGLEATVAWGYLDLKFANDTPDGILITTESGGDFITVTIWGNRQYDDIVDESSDRFNTRPYTTIYDASPECTGQQGVDGFDITVDRVFIRDGDEVRRETFSTSYDPTNNIICGSPPGPASSKPTPSGEKSGGGGGNGGGRD